MSKMAGWQLTVYGRLINNQIILLFNTFISELCVSVGCWCSGSGVPHHTLHSAGCLPELQPRTFGHWRSEQPSDLAGPLSPPHPDPPLWTSCRPGLNRWLPLLTDLRNQRKNTNTRALPRVHMRRGVCVCVLPCSMWNRMSLARVTFMIASPWPVVDTAPTLLSA